MIAFRSATSRKKPRPRIPAAFRVYAVGDIHGRADLLEVLLERIDADLAKNPVPRSIQIFLGDYIDRGPASRQVLDKLVARKLAHQTVFLRGNHEALLTDFIHDPTILKDWQRLGGLETMMSYGIVPLLSPSAAGQVELAAALDQALTDSHHQFLSELKLSFTFGDYFFVHAGVRPGIPLAKQREEDLLWIRQDFLHCEDDFSKIIIHGHTPVPQPEIRPNRINIDTGAYATGQLTCLVLEGDIARIL
jgi:diadenosine tetraphosphatase ApaH/serine/threonine PP2A family protein phosphatase